MQTKLTPRWRYLFLILSAVLLIADSIGAQYHYFGRNKVQYTDFDWHVLKTEHFNIYFYPGMQDVAEVGAAAAESGYADLSVQFNHTLDRRVPLIFYSSHLLFQQTNITPGFIPEGVGGFFEFIKGRVVIPSNGSMNQFRRVISHEMVHVFMTSKVNRILKDRGQLTHPGPPLWFIEGLAEFWSTSVLDPQSKMILRDAVLNNYFVPLTEIHRITGSYLMYKEGESLLTFIAKEYGPEKLLLLIENIWRDEDFGKVLEFVLGDPVEEISRKWHFWLKKQIYPLLEKESLPQPTTEMITQKGVNLSPAVYESHGEKRVAFVSNRIGYTNIYSKPINAPKKQEPKLLVKGERNQQYEAFHFMDSELSVSKENILAFVTKSGEQDALHLYDLDEEERVTSVTFNNLIGISAPHWNAKGKKIVFSGMAFSGKVDLYIYDTESGHLVRLMQDFYNDRSPIFSPDGKYIYFSSDRTNYGESGYSNIFRYHLENGNIEYVTHERSHDSHPAISPDGTRLAYISDRGGTNNIWIRDITGNSEASDQYQLQQVTDFATAALHPGWMTDSTLVCTAFDDYQFQLHRVEYKPRQPTKVHWASFQENVWDYPRFEVTDSSRINPYNRKYSLDVAASQISNDPIFGTSGGGQMAFSDILGNHRWEILLYNSAETADEFWRRFNVFVAKYNLSHRANYGYGIFHFNNLYYNPREGFYNERRYGGMFMLRYPFSQFRRLEASLTLNRSRKDDFIGEPRNAFLVSNFIGYVKDNSIWGPTGPMDGQRFLVRTGYTTDLRYNNVNYYTLIGDYRHYLRLTQRTSYALRIMGLRSDGYEAQRFYIGGSWTLRGYPRFRIWGKNVFLWNNELRFPLMDQIGVQFPFGGIGFRQVRGALFVDAGNAWENEYPGFRGSFGLGIRVNLGGVLVLRYDIGRRTDFTSIGDGTFYQFFFGWDY
ncbi:MAG: Protein TolB [Candidatus Marinimicrobia bacterium]|nr:Protein TolB [Candidatus Neomarinimicrobiota bacterium]